MTEENTSIVPYTLPDIRDLLAGRLAPNTIKVYREDTNQYAKFARLHDLQQFDSQTLVAWRDHLILTTAMSPNTINRMLAAIRRTVKEAASRRMVPSGVAFDFANVESVSIRALRDRLKKNNRVRIFPEQMRVLCDTPDVSTLVGLRDRALLHTLASSGLRITEAIGLTQEQIEQRGAYYILSIIGKSDIEAREAHLSAEAKAHIDRWVQQRLVPSRYIFTQFDGRGEREHSRLTVDPLTRQGAWNIVRKYALLCGLTYFHPHSMRAFVATELASRDIVKAQKALGHANINTTSKYYVLSGISAGETDNLF